MHTAPMSESEGDFKDGWNPSKGTICSKCKTEAVFYREWESSCGGYNDTKYECRACGHSWWVDGPDA